MRVALLTTFAASKKDPLASVMERIHQAFLDAGLGKPVVRFNFGDASTHGFVSSVDRVLKRHPELARFVMVASPMPGIPGARRISNEPMSPAAGDTAPFSTLLAIASSVPRSFPFQVFAIHFHAPEFGEYKPGSLTVAETSPGILLTDNWWVNGRDRSLTACTVVEAGPASKNLPPPPANLAAVLAACGKAKKTVQAPLPPEGLTGPAPGVRLPGGHMVASANPEAARAVHEIVVGYRARLSEIIERAALPHELPEPGAGLDVVSGPRKPALERVFKPMGYSCKVESGTYTLRRRTAGNLSAELHLDAGGPNVLAMFRVSGVGFKGTVLLPISANAIAGAQYPIGDAERWEKIVENLAALVVDLDRSLVPEIEAKVGPSPEWYQPES